MDTFGDYYLENGDMVLITDDCRLGDKGRDINITAQYCGKQEVEIAELGATMETPTFAFEDGELIHGFECYWLPLGIANRIRLDNGLPQIGSKKA